MHDSIKVKLAVTVAFLCSGTHAFNAPRPTATSLNAHTHAISKSATFMSTYDYDPDEDSEQLLTAKSVDEGTHGSAVNGDDAKDSKTRFGALLSDVGLAGQLASLNFLPDKRPVSYNDVFCNRELNLGNVRAVGFDMDYTIAQYKQPAFDKLAFDGAKEKLVHKFGYPEALLDVEYDHTVSIVLHCIALHRFGILYLFQTWSFELILTHTSFFSFAVLGERTHHRHPAR